MNSLRKTRLCTAILIPALLCAVLLGASSAVRATEIDFSRYAAVAYSKSTGKYGYGWNHYSKYAAEQCALSNCPEDDAKIVGWVKGGWLVLAIGDEKAYGVGWEYGDGAVNTVAAEKARRECHAQGQRVKTYVILCSGHIRPRIEKIN